VAFCSQRPISAISGADGANRKLFRRPIFTGR